MRLNAPTQALWIIAVVLGAVGIITHPDIVRVRSISPYSFWLLAIGFIILVVATLIRRA